MARDVILYRSHILDAVVERELRKLRRELPGYDHVFLGYRDLAPLNDPLPCARGLAEIATGPFVILSHRDLASLPYPAKAPEAGWANEGGGNDDLPILWFFRRNKHYDNYWCIEYDVRYPADWGFLFADLASSNADLLATTIMDRNAIPQWEWWRTLAWREDEIAPEHHTKAFQPFCRLSNRALHAIDAAYRGGVSGHYEVTWPTICRMSGLVLEDIGGDGPYTPPLRINKHYTNTPLHWALYPGTFTFRPTLWDRDFAEFSGGLTHGPKLWHPVKW